jgi:hypothetical protein
MGIPLRSIPTGDGRVLGGYAAENRGADFVQHLVLSPCARTRHWTRCDKKSLLILLG